MKLKLKIGLLAMILALFPQPVTAEVTSVEISSTSSLGEFDGKPYLAITGFMHGTVVREDGTSGVYKAPLFYEFPANSSDCNGFGVGEPLHHGSGLGGRASLVVIGPNYMFGNGYVHAGVGWDRSPDAGAGRRLLPPIPPVPPEPLPSETLRLSDAHQVLKDLSSLLRNPSPFLQGPCAVDQVIGFGTSRTSSFWRDFLRLGNNNPILFDGLLINAIGALRLDLSGTVRQHVSYPGPLPEDGKIIEINNEHDVERYQGWDGRPETPSYRVYETAGTAHLSTRALNLTPFPFLALRQNPEDHASVARAMLRHLHDWIAHGTEPPPSVILPGTVVDVPDDDKVPMIGCVRPPIPPTPIKPRCKMYQFIRDDFGNATGGVRLPFVVVPIGTYTGVETENLLKYPNGTNRPVNFQEIVSQGGTFTSFDQDTLKALYPNHGSYVKRIADAAGTARDNGWILGEDVGLYTSEGANLSVGMPMMDDGSVSEGP